MSDTSLITLKKEGSSRIEIKQSVFIGNAAPVSSREEADAFVADIRRKYPDARHSCYAWKIDRGMHMQKYSDDGEPSGTAGLPILGILEHNDITDSLIVVTRYFGGILLGKGGLVRAYTEAAAEAVKDAGLIRITEGEAYKINLGYDLADKIIRELSNAGFTAEDISYTTDVEIKAVCSSSDSKRLIELVTNASAGRAVIVKDGKRDLKSDIDRGDIS